MVEMATRARMPSEPSPLQNKLRVVTDFVTVTDWLRKALTFVEPLGEATERLQATNEQKITREESREAYQKYFL